MGKEKWREGKGERKKPQNPQVQMIQVLLVFLFSLCAKSPEFFCNKVKFSVPKYIFLSSLLKYEEKHWYKWK